MLQWITNQYDSVIQIIILNLMRIVLLAVLLLGTIAQQGFLYDNEVSNGNPFDTNTHDLYVNPYFADEVMKSKTLSAAQKSKLSQISAAFWVDTMSAISQRTPSLKTLLDGAKAKQASSGKKQTVFFIHYNLPNRDCAASASNGEICCSGNSPSVSTGACDDQSYFGGSCDAGLSKYRSYTDQIVNLLKGYPELEIVALVEPDSLPNLATNLNVKPHCTQTTASAYIAGVSYAISKLSTISNLQMYVDVGHGGWLGWCGSQPCSDGNQCGGDRCVRGFCECPFGRTDQNAQKFVAVIKSIFDSVGAQAVSKVRGFATNTANYQPLGYPEDDDFCQLKSQWNFAFNELRYIDHLDMLFKKNGISKTWITDTGRNGAVRQRLSPFACEQWCNIKGGLGPKPTSNVSKYQAVLQSATLDALVWSKTPGESDGCSPGSGQTCQRVDQMCQRDCNSAWQVCPAPEAGNWHDDAIKILVDNANPSLLSEELIE